MQQFVFNLNVPSRWGTQCVDEATECLTENGWRRHDFIEKGEKILVTSYGSGAGADSFLFECTSELEIRRKKWCGFLHEQIEQCSAITYEEYRKNTT